MSALAARMQDRSAQQGMIQMKSIKSRGGGGTGQPGNMAMKPEIWRTIFDAIEEPAFLHDEQFRLTLTNLAYCQAAGVTEAQALGKPYWEVFPPGSGPLPGCLAAATGTGDTASQDEVSVDAKLFLSKGYTVRGPQNQYLYSLHLLSDITAQRQGVAALAASEERMRLAIETARDAIITVDGNGGTVSAWNPAAEAIFGYSRQEAMGRVLHDFLAPERFRATATQAMAHFAASGQGAAIDKTLELVALHKNGTEFPIELSLTATQLHGTWQATGIARDISQRKRAEQALRESEEHHRSLVAALSEGVVLQDATGTITMVNRNAERLLGLGSGQLLGSGSIDPRWYAIREDGSRFPGEAHPAMLTLRTGVPQSDVIMGIHRPDGALSWISVNTQPLIEPGQALPAGVVSSLRDITESKAVEERLRLANTVVENSPAVLFRWRAAQGWPVEYVSRNVSQFGYSAEELLSGAVPYASMVYPEDLERVAAEVARYSAGGGERFAQEYRLLTRDGVVRWIDDRTTIERDAQGQVLHYQGVLTDITERKRAEEALRASEEKYRTLFEESFDGLFITSVEGKILDMNKKGVAMFGYDTKEEVQRLDLERDVYAHPLDRQRILAMVNARGSAEYEVVVKKKSGEQMTTYCALTAVRDQSGTISTFRGIIRDIAERKRGELALARADRALRTLSACNEALVRTTTEPELLDAICRLVVETGGYRMAWVGFPEQDAASTVRAVAHHGHDDGFLAAARISWADTERGRGPTGSATRTGSVQVDQNFQTNPALAPWREAALARGYQSGIALPLKSTAGTLGTLTIYATEPDAFNEAEVALLLELAEDLAFGIQTLRTRLERDRIAHEHLHHAEILRHSLQDSIKAIADTVEMRDPYTAGHQRRVGQLAIAIAKEMDLPGQEIQGIGLAASIHDLGKISVPAEILSKPGKLSALEFMLLKNHAQAGFDILKDIQFPWPIATMVLQHHERQDGSGYPQGLQGQQILLQSRILAVADVVEAMASHRPYREALGVASALQEIERGRGTAFDAAVADACLRLFAQKRFVFSE